MTVWPQEHDEEKEEKELHALSDKDYKVLEYFAITISIGVAIFCLLALFR